MNIQIRDRVWTLRAPVSSAPAAAPRVRAAPRLFASWSRDAGDGRLRRAWRAEAGACEPPSRCGSQRRSLRRAA